MSNSWSPGPGGQMRIADAGTLDLAGNASVGPTIFIPSGMGKLERAISVNGGVLNGTADDSAPLINAFNSLTARQHFELWMPPVAAIKCNSGMVLDISNKYIHFNGAILDFSGMTSGTAITLTQTDRSIIGGTNSFGNVMHGIDKIHMKGPGRASAVDGLLFTGGTDVSVGGPVYGSARSTLARSIVYGFRKGITWHHRAYLCKVEYTEIGSNRLGIHLKGGGIDAYENMGIFNSVIGNNNVNIYIEDGQMYLIGTSIDYAENVQVAVRAGLASFTDCHLEFRIQNVNYGLVGGIYSTPSPLCAIDLQPGGSGVSTIATDLDLNSTTPSTGDWGAFAFKGGMFAVTGASGAGGVLRTYVNMPTNGNASFMGRHLVNFTKDTIPTSGYVAAKLTAYNLTDNQTNNYNGNLIWEPALWLGNDVPHIAYEAPAHVAVNPGIGLSLSPAHNEMISFGFNQTSGAGFEGTVMTEDLFLLADTAPITSRLSGAAGSASFDTAEGVLSTSRSLRFTKTGAVGDALKFGIRIPMRHLNGRPTFRGYVKKNAANAPALGSIVVDIGYCKLKEITMANGDTRYDMIGGFKFGGVATSASGTNTKNNSAFKFSFMSMYVAVDTASTTLNAWTPFQINSNADAFVPHFCSDIVIIFDLTAMGPGAVDFDALDTQWF